MAEPSPSPSTTPDSSLPPISTPNPNPNPNPESQPQPQPQSQSQSQPNSTPPQPSSSTPPPPVNPNPSSAPAYQPPQINPYTAPPLFRPAGPPPPMFTPVTHNPNLQGFPNHAVQPPGVSSAQQQPPQQQQQPQYQQPQYQQQQQPQQYQQQQQPQQYQQQQQPQQYQQQQQQPQHQQQQPQQIMMGGQPGIRPPYMAMPNGYMHPPPGSLPPPGAVRYPYPTIVRPAFLPRPGVAVGTVPPLPRPSFLGLRPPVTLPIVRPPVAPVVVPLEKPQTTVYVGKIASTVENDFIHSLLEMCGPIKSWKRAQDPSDGTPRRFGFCEFESAEGVLRALRLLSKCNVDGEELVLNVNQATREYLERYVEKKKENLNKPSESGVEETKKEGENASDIEKVEGDEKKDVEKGEGDEKKIVEKGEDDEKKNVEKGEGDEKTKEPAKTAVEEPKKDMNDSENKENDHASFGLVTDEERDADREALEKLTNMIEERIKTKPPPPPPPPAQKVADGTDNSNSEASAKSGDKDSDIGTVKTEEKNEDETTSEIKPTNRAGTESPDRRRYDNRSRVRERDRRDKERELDRLERERERERARRERERDLEIQKAERFYKERVKEWETREKEREYERKREREKEKERERERRRLIAEQEDESDDDSRKRRRKSDIEDKRRRRRREKEDDLADRLKEEEEIVEGKKKAEEEQQRQQEKPIFEPPPAPVANESEKLVMPEVAASESKDDMEQDHVIDSAPASHAGDEAVENGNTDEPITAPESTSDAKFMGNAPAKKLGFGLVGSGKRTAVPSVFREEEDDAQKEKKMRPLVPIDYSTEELQAVHANDGETPPITAVSAETGKHVNPREAKSDVERERRRTHERSSHRDRERDEAPRSRDIIDAKQLIDMIPKTKDDLFSYKINWSVYDENRLHERMRPWISKKITEFLGEEENTLVEFIVDRFREHVKAEKMLDVLQRILDEEAEMFVLKMWRMLIFEIKRVETGLTARPGA